AADYGFSGGAEGLRFSTLAEGVVEDDDVGPLAIFFVAAGFGDKAVGDVAFFFVFDVIADFVAFLDYLPGDVADQAGKGNEKKFIFVHERGRVPPGKNGFQTL